MILAALIIAGLTCTAQQKDASKCSKPQSIN